MVNFSGIPIEYLEIKMKHTQNKLPIREISGNGCLAKIRSAYTSLSAAERRVADLLLSQPLEVIHFSISLAQDSTPVMQYIQEDILPTDTSSLITRKVLQANIEALSETLKMLNNTEMEKAIEAIINAQRVGFYGVAAFFLAVSKKNAATTICITNYSGSPLTKVSDIKLITSFKESGFPIEKMGARVAQLSIIEALAVNVAVQIPQRSSEHMEKLRTILKELM